MPQFTSPMNKHTVIFLLGLAIIFILVSITIFSIFLADYSRFNLTTSEKRFTTLFSALGLPITLLMFSQIFIQYRGVKTAVWSVFWGALIAMLGNIPLTFTLLAH